MTDAKRLLLVLKEANDGTHMLLEVDDPDIRNELVSQVKKHGLEYSMIGLEEYDRTIYRGSRYFDLRNPLTLRNFRVTDWVDFLKHWDEHERLNE